MIHVDAARLRIGLDLDRAVIGKRGAGGIGTVRVVGYQHDVAMSLAVVFMVGFDEHQARQLAMRARRGLQRDTRHARNFRQVLLQFVDQLDRALHRAVWLQGMDAREAGQYRHVLVDLGIVLHGAGAERVEACIHAEIALRKVRIVAHDLDFAHLRQRREVLCAA